MTEKIFTIYDDTKAAQKDKKRAHAEDKDKDKDAKKSRFRDDDVKNEKTTEAQLSADKVLEFCLRLQFFTYTQLDRSFSLIHN